MPFLFRQQNFKTSIDKSIRKTILYIRRFSIILILLFAYLYDEYVAQYFSLVESKRADIENVFQSTLSQGFKWLFISAALFIGLGFILTIFLKNKKQPTI